MKFTKGSETKCNDLTTLFRADYSLRYEEVLEQAGYVVRATGDLATAVDMVAASKIDLFITYPEARLLKTCEAYL